MLPEAFSFKKARFPSQTSSQDDWRRKLGVYFSFKKQSGDFVEKWNSFIRKGIWFLEVHRELKSCGVSLHNARILMFGFALVTGLNTGEAHWLTESGMEGLQICRTSERMLSTSVRREAPQLIVQRLRLPPPMQKEV